MKHFRLIGFGAAVVATVAVTAVTSTALANPAAVTGQGPVPAKPSTVQAGLVEAGDGAGFVFGAVPGAGGTGTTLRLTLADQLDSRLDPPLTLDGSTGPRPYALAVLVSGGAADGLRVELVDGAGRVAASEPVERG